MKELSRYGLRARDGDTSDKLEATFDEVDANDHISQDHAIVLAHCTIIVDI